MAIESINPATNKLLRRFEPLTQEASRQKIAIAADAFRSYANVPLDHRALCPPADRARSGANGGEAGHPPHGEEGPRTDSFCAGQH